MGLAKCQPTGATTSDRLCEAGPAVDLATSRPQQPASERNGGHTGGWGKAIIIGTISGVPTAMFHQFTFIKTLAQRGESIRGMGSGRAMVWWMVPGLLPAIGRDVCYQSATQKQVQNSSPSAFESVLCWTLVVAAPIFFDTLSVKAVHPGYSRPKITSFRSVLSLLRYGCPPEALLGRLIWVPFYNLAFIRVQQQIGDGSAAHETTGLIAGSLIASCVAYPFFMFKTSLLLEEVRPTDVLARRSQGAATSATAATVSRLRGTVARMFGERTMADVFTTLKKRGGFLTLTGRIFSGVGPHTVGNFGPDVFCTGLGRAVYMIMLSRGVAPPDPVFAWE